VIRAVRKVSLSRVKEVSGKRACTGVVCRVVVVCNDESAGGISQGVTVEMGRGGIRSSSE
jgi:hypothetical protein